MWPNDLIIFQLQSMKKRFQSCRCAMCLTTLHYTDEMQEWCINKTNIADLNLFVLSEQIPDIQNTNASLEITCFCLYTHIFDIVLLCSWWECLWLTCRWSFLPCHWVINHSDLIYCHWGITPLIAISCPGLLPAFILCIFYHQGHKLVPT